MDGMARTSFAANSRVCRKSCATSRWSCTRWLTGRLTTDALTPDVMRDADLKALFQPLRLDSPLTRTR